MNIKVAESHKKQTHGDIYEIQLFLQLLSFFRHSCVLFFSQSFQVDVIVLSTSPPLHISVNLQDSVQQSPWVLIQTVFDLHI